MACKEPTAGRNTQQPIQSKRSCKEQIPCTIPETDCNQSGWLREERLTKSKLLRP